MAAELKDATFENLKEKGLAAKVTDYYNKPILEEEYEHYVGHIDVFKEFLNEAAKQGNYLVFSEG